MSSPKSKETPVQKIKRLEKELADEKLKNLILNKMIDIADKQYGDFNQKKVFTQTTLVLQVHQTTSLLHSCRLFGVSRQSIHQNKHA